jgi:type II secretory pathway pseudopilin PulG
MILQVRTTRPNLLFIGIVAVLIAAMIGGLMAMRQRRVRIVAEKGLRREIRENNDGVQEMRAAIPTEIENVSHTVALLEQRETGAAVDGSQVKIGLAVMSFTNANWQTASVTGAMSSIDYDTVERFAGAYFEQARLAQLQTSTMESMMSLSSYVGHGEKLQSMSPGEARAAEIQAQALLAHLKMMSRMTEGVQDAYKKALGS